MNELDALLAKIVGQPCWSMVGMSGGSMFALDFGKRLKRKVPVGNDMLREEQRNFRGEYRLFVQCSGWKLFLEKKCLCHCNDSNANDSPMVAGLRQLEGQTVLRSKTGNTPAELMVAFSGGYKLFLADWEGVEPDSTAYTASGEGEFISVTMNGAVSIEHIDVE